MCLKIRIYAMLVASMMLGKLTYSQTATLELTTGGANGLSVPGSGFGPRTTAHTVTFEKDLINNSNFSIYSPTLTVQVSLNNQQYTGLTYGTGSSNPTTTGLVFGAGPSLSTGGTIQQVSPLNSYDILGAFNGTGGPRNGMFMSSPSAVPTVSPYPTQSGVGIDATGDAFGNDVNAGVEVFTTAQVLYDQFPPNGAPNTTASRYYFGDLVITFSRIVNNPVIQIAGLGGSYRYLPIGAPSSDSSNYLSTFFSTELELQSNYTMTKMAGNQFLSLSGQNILNNALKPNGESFFVAPSSNLSPSNFGAATGSIRVNGFVKTLTFKVWLRGSNASQFNWSGTGIGVVTGATRPPLTGDIWYVSPTMDKPTQQISGNVFTDLDGLTDNRIDSSTTLGAWGNRNTTLTTLHANLINNLGIVIATVPVTNGLFLFDNVVIGTGYTVQLSTNTGTVGLAMPATALPPTWINSGERIGLGTGGDGTNNGITAVFNVNANDIITNVNFGITHPAQSLCPLPQLYLNETLITSNYFGGFEAGASNFNVNVVGSQATTTGSSWTARTTLAASKYNITHSPYLVDPTFEAYPPALDANMMLVKSPVANDVVWYLLDTVHLGPAPHRYFKAGVSNSFFAYFSKVNFSTDPVVRVKIYNPYSGTIYSNTTSTISADPGTWTLFTYNWTLPGIPGNASINLDSVIRMDIISVNGVPFSIDNLCTVTPTLLPIKLLNFTATKQANSVLLNWNTSTETNSKNFDIQFSTDGIHWQTIGTVAAAGNSNVQRNYSFVHTSPVKGTNYYRLKQNDLDARFEYSDTKEVTFDGAIGIKVLPNPVMDKVYITSTSVTSLESVTLYSAEGKLVQRFSNFTIGDNINMSRCAAGTYLLKITDKAGITETVKVVKINGQ